MDGAERTTKIEEYGRGFELLEAALTEIPRAAWLYQPGAEEWSVHEIIVHMADSESMAALRARKLIVEPGTDLMAYEEARWAKQLHYAEHDVDDALQVIRLARKTTYRLLKTLRAEVFDHAVRHPEYTGRYTLDVWLDIYSRHVPDHVAQLKRAHDAWRHAGEPATDRTPPPRGPVTGG